jgi:hypothetical protein
MQLKLQIFLAVGRRLIPSETPSLLLLTGPNIISSNRNVDISLIISFPKLTFLAEAVKYEG